MELSRVAGRIVRGASSTTLLSSITVMVLTTITGIFSARLLSVEDRGTLSATLAVTSLLTFVAVAGASEATVLAPRRGVDRRSVATITWSWSILLGTVGSGVVLFYLHVVGSPSVLFSCLACVTPVIGTLGALTNYELVRMERYPAAAILRLSPLVVQVLLIVILAVTENATLTTLMLASVMGSVVAGLVSLTAIHPRRRWRIGVQLRDIKTVVKVGTRTGLAQLGRAVSSRCDLVLVSVLIGSTASGLLSVASSLSVAATSLIGSLAPVLLSRPERANAAAVSAASTITWAMGVFIAFVGPFVVPLIYGDSYGGLYVMLATLAAATVATTQFELLSRLLQSSGLEQLVWRSTTLALLIQVVVVICISVYGSVQLVPIGALVGYAVGLCSLTVGASGREARRQMKMLNPIRVFVGLSRVRYRSTSSGRKELEVENGSR